MGSATSSIQVNFTTKEPITTIAKRNLVAKKVSEEIKVYTEEDHLNGVNDNIKEMYQARIRDLGNDIQIKSNKKYIDSQKY